MPHEMIAAASSGIMRACVDRYFRLLIIRLALPSLIFLRDGFIFSPGFLYAAFSRCFLRVDILPSRHFAWSCYYFRDSPSSKGRRRDFDAMPPPLHDSHVLLSSCQSIFPPFSLAFIILEISALWNLFHRLQVYIFYEYLRHLLT